MSTGNVHLIVTCTRRKTVPADDAVFPDERDVERAYGLADRPLDRRRAVYGLELEQGSCGA